jgi:hypothetical protein
MIQKVLLNGLFFLATQKYHATLQPSCNRDESGLFAHSSDPTAMVCSSEEKRFDERVHGFPTLLGKPI